MDYKNLATILFRVLGIAYFLYGIFYAPYVLMGAAFEGTFIMASLAILSYFAPGICLFLFSKPLAALVVTGLNRHSVPPPPPRFENS